ncbi:DNA repair protein RAD51 homolog 3-like [Bradysia coprophila]|uniref:DNA repair protein RAD51 homolog 3-like n=1 Tax=Bradysia coprophila TaxID=38358 RepID=UPI00187D8C3D|nr:DNA repair protein RAD51 homolog 3-like [Bradysia coprophila]
MFAETATSKWQKEFSSKRIRTSCRELDVALSNGIPTGVITEFCGPPGCGKTQICLQLCVNVQLPGELDGLDGEAVFIDTNCGYSPYRFRSIATAQSTLCRNVSQNFHSTPVSVLMDKFMNGIKSYFVRDYGELLAVIHNLWTLLAENCRIRLIVIDSFSCLFRNMKGDVILSQTVYVTLTNLQKLANNFGCAIVLTNELTRRPVSTSDMPDFIVPTLGDSHLHRIGQLITLDQECVGSDIFLARIDKALHAAETVVKFRITENGIESAAPKRLRTQ